MKRINLLLKEIPDKYVQDNFRRLKLYLDDLANDVNVTNNNVTNISSESEWDRKEDLVSASSSGIVDRIEYSTFHSARHVCTIYNDVEGKAKTFDILTVKKSGDVADSLYNKKGDVIDAWISVTLNAGFVEYTLTNNESYNTRVVIKKLVH